MKKYLLALLGLVALIGVLVVMMNKPPPLPPLPQPNGYDDLVKAGRIVVPFETANLTDLKVEELRTRVTANQESLLLARAGLGRECRVALDFSTQDLSISNHIAQVSSFKALARAFLAEGSLAERENRPADAARAYLDAVRLGHECCRGGVVIDRMVGAACQTLGCRALEGMIEKLPAADCREAVRQLEELHAKAGTLEAVFQQEYLWARRTSGLRGQIAMLLMRSSQEQVRQKMREKAQANQQEVRQLLTQLETRAAEREITPGGGKP